MKGQIKFLNLFKIYMPLTAWVSIAHRISGLILAVLMFWAMYTLYFIHVCNEYSWRWLTSQPLWYLPGYLAIISFVCHLVAGIRHMIDDHMLSADLSHAVCSAKWALVVMAVLSVISICGFML